VIAKTFHLLLHRFPSLPLPLMTHGETKRPTQI